MSFFRILTSVAALLTAACNSTLPTKRDMERFYAEAEKSVQRDVDQLKALRDRGRITQEEYARREAAIRDTVGRRASEMAWTKHELAQSELRNMGIPTPENAVWVQPPGGRGSSVAGSFQRVAGQTGSGFQQNSTPRIFRPN